MTIKLLAFSRCAEAVGASIVSWELAEVTTVESLLVSLKAKYPKLSGMNLVIAVNQEVAVQSKIVQAGDEVALLPPVSGG